MVFGRTEMSKRVIRFAIGNGRVFEARKSSRSTSRHRPHFNMRHAVLEAAQRSINRAVRYDRERLCLSHAMRKIVGLPQFRASSANQAQLHA